ncbi:unnamed protein product [Bursaphelenchus okinawaensis]|uniref:glutathione transferase n=1 Tax=Bursaphelenchus okinawaensis TaxID=465554 RepID=A0A811KDB3_9BILA|nr:unnamed protein product [Bursaphelenchus okinawaensis]CAG9101462.1 unnamed protein product [Bursaphelenchus okinawaensis]
MIRSRILTQPHNRVVIHRMLAYSGRNVGMPKYELTYFNFRGRGEPIRQILHYGKVPFEDTKVTMEQWGGIKEDKKRFPYGQMPVFSIDGTLIAQSHSITRYVAAVAKVAGKNSVEAAEIDQVYELCREFADAITPYRRVCLGFLPGDKDQIYKEVFVPAVEKYCPMIQDHIGTNGFLHQGGISYADFYFSDLFLSLQLMHPAIFDKYPKLVELKRKMLGLPELQDYFKQRGDQPF